MPPALVWFRRDLRLSDNPAWAAACRGGTPVVALYVHAPEEEGEGAPGAASRWWLHHSLAALDAGLRALGGALVLRRGPSLAAIEAVIAETGCTSVHWNRVHEPAAIARDSGIKTRLRARGVEVHSGNSALLVEPWAIATNDGAPYRVFTPFWRKARATIEAVATVASPRRPRFAPPPASEALDALELAPRIAWDAGFSARWRPGEAGARTRLRDFAKRVGDYAATRDRPDLDATSCLSPHLHFGEIGPRQALAALRDAHGAIPTNAEAFVRELGWREFSAHLLFHFPHTVRENMDRRFERFAWAAPDAARLAAWQRGRTGIPLVDAGMRQLWREGWMHNRVRMVVASFLTKNLRYHWLEGAEWFRDTLVDADLANNTQGWQWAAGTGADAAPYFRVFNPIAQGQRFDPHGAYVRRYVPELAGVADRLVHLPYGRPIVDLAASRAEALAAYAALRGRV